MSFTVGIIGGGIAGSTIALKLAENGIRSVLFEAGHQLINGPPVCHLHAGGALYRDIPINQCLNLLQESIDTLKTYRYSANERPTLLTVPLRDPGSPQQIIQRLKIVKRQYQKLVQKDITNAVLGNPANYFKTFTKEEVYRLREQELPFSPTTFEDWLIPVAKDLDLQQFKFPFVMVQQYGLSFMRTSAYANIALESSLNCQVLLNSAVTNIQQTQEKEWIISYIKGKHSEKRKVQILINASGYKSGYIDDMAGYKRERMLEFKASYVTQWGQCKGYWPQVIIHGQRNTPFGMVQLTPYAKNIFQVHVMSQEVTLFEKGLVASTDGTSQPKFDKKFNKILEQGWEEQEAIDRTSRAIINVSNFINSFSSATCTKKPLYGAQQIPGVDPELRATQISYEGQNYARSEIVKASTAIRVANDFLEKLKQWFSDRIIVTRPRESFQNIKEDKVLQRAKRIAIQRNYPEEIADYYK